MPNPQQPELRRSDRGATSDDSAKARADHTLHGADPLPEDATPEDNRPGHRPERDQDQPDPARVAERLGLRADEDDR